MNLCSKVQVFFGYLFVQHAVQRWSFLSKSQRVLLYLSANPFALSLALTRDCAAHAAFQVV